MDHPLVWQSIVLAACIACGFAALLFLIASLRTGYHVGRIVFRDATKRMRTRREHA